MQGARGTPMTKRLPPQLNLRVYSCPFVISKNKNALSRFSRQGALNLSKTKCFRLIAVKETIGTTPGFD
jgi:hypothetical protein